MQVHASSLRAKHCRVFNVNGRQNLEERFHVCTVYHCQLVIQVTDRFVNRP